MFPHDRVITSLANYARAPSRAPSRATSCAAMLVRGGGGCPAI